MSEDEDAVVDFGDILHLMDEENAITMGGFDNRECCTFTKGYMKRQAVYTCLTCLDICKVRAGFCYPCLLNCHAGHDTLELYTKRQFRCDCGNAKFPGEKCTLWEEKDDENIDNRYNDNFTNRYCICKRPYPDDEYEGDEEMLQCGICEDWYHFEHLNLPEGKVKPGDTEYEELTCFGCLEKCPFLCLYAIENNNYFHTNLELNGNEDETLRNSYISPKRLKLEKNSEVRAENEDCNTNSCLLVEMAERCGYNTNDFAALNWRKLECIKSDRLHSVFQPSGWRKKLCKCENCQDTMEHYLKAGEKKADEIDKEESKALTEALSELPHPVAINVAEGVNQFKNALFDFLAKSRKSGHVITEAEVRCFFEKLREQRHY